MSIVRTTWNQFEIVLAERVSLEPLASMRVYKGFLDFTIILPIFVDKALRVWDCGLQYGTCIDSGCAISSSFLRRCSQCRQDVAVPEQWRKIASVSPMVSTDAACSPTVGVKLMLVWSHRM